MSLMNLSHFDFICGLQHVFFFGLYDKKENIVISEIMYASVLSHLALQGLDFVWKILK